MEWINGEKRDLYWVYSVTFIFSIATGVTIPVIPVYTSFLGGSYIDVGMLGTTYAVIYTFLAIPIGKMLNRFRRKWFLTLSGFLGLLSALFYISSFKVVHLYIPKALEGVAWVSFWVSSETLITDLTHSSIRGFSLGLSTASYGVGFFLGSLLGGFMAASIGLKSVFYFYLLLSLVAVILSLFIKERREPVHSSDGMVFHPLTRPSIISYLVPAYIVAVTYSVILSVITNLFPLYAERMGVEIAWIGGLLSLFWFVRIFSFILSGRLSDRVGRVNMLVPALVGVMVASFFLTQSTELNTFILSFLIYGGGLGATFPTTIAMISEVVSYRKRGLSMAFFEMSFGIGQLIGSAVGGFLADFYVPIAPYYMCIVLSIVSVLILILATRLRR